MERRHLGTPRLLGREPHRLGNNGMAFTLWDGTASWDRAGKLATQPDGLAFTDLSAPALFFTGGTLDFTSVLEPSTGE